MFEQETLLHPSHISFVNVFRKTFGTLFSYTTRSSGRSMATFPSRFSRSVSLDSFLFRKTPILGED